MNNTKTSPKSSVIKNSIFIKVMQARMVAMLVVMVLLSTTAFSSTASAGTIQDFLNAASASAANLFGFTSSNASTVEAGSVNNPSNQNNPQATISVDKTDYLPGETVTIAGSAWAPHEIVTLVLKEDPANHADTILTSQADEYGNLLNMDFTPTEEHVGTTFTLTATGQTSGKTATITFTDGGTMAYGPSTKTLYVRPGESRSFTQTVTAPKDNGSFDATLKVVGISNSHLPEGWVTASLQKLSFATTKDNADSKDWTITVSVPSGTSPSDYSAKIQSLPPNSVNVSNNAGTNLTVKVLEENVPPTTTAAGKHTVSNNTYTSGTWTNTQSSITVTLTAQDSESEVAETKYRLCEGSVCGAYQVYSAPFTVSAEGTTTVQYFSVDNLGNQEINAQPFVVKIDRTNPTVSLSSPANGASVSGTVELVATASDTPSGINRVEFYLNGAATPVCTDTSALGGWTCSPASLSNGNYTWYARAYDNAGNTAIAPTTGTRNFTVNNTVSTTTTVTSNSAQNTSTYGDNVTFTATVAGSAGTNPTSGSVQFKIDGANAGGAVSLTNAGTASYQINTLSVNGGTAHTVEAVFTAASGSNFGTSNGSLANGQTVTAKALTVTGLSASNKVYDGNTTATLTGTPTLVGVINNEVSLAGTAAGAFADAGVGNNKPVAVTGLSLTGTATAKANYSLTLPTGLTANITAKPVTVTPNSGQSKVFGASDPTLTYTLGETVTVTGALGRATGEDAGSYAINLGTLASSNTNYALTLAATTISFEITRKAVTITPNSNQSKVFGASDPALTFSNDGSLAPASFTGALSRATGENVGNYAIGLGNLSAGNNYNLSLASSVVNFAITPKPVTVTPSSGQSKVFGASDPALTFSNNGNLAADAFTGSLSRAQGEDAGNYAIGLGNLSAGNNYALTLAPTTINFVITAKPVTVTPTSGQSKVFGNADPTLTYTLGEQVAVAGALSRAAGTDVGNYAITMGTLAATSSNYQLVMVSPAVTFAITPKPVTVTPDAGQSKVYGTNDPTLTFSNNANLAANSFSGALARAAGTDVGNYAITLGTLSAGNNYSLSLSATTVNFAITSKSLTITANAASRQYSDPDPVFSVSYNGFIPGEGPGNLSGMLAFTTNATATSAPGPYTITPSGLTSSNYAITFVTGALTVAQENALAIYTGQYFVATSSTSSGAATITLSASVQDITAATGDSAYDAYAGDIRNAKVTFYNGSTAITGCTNLSVGLVNTSDTKTGSVGCQWSVNIGNAESETYDVAIVVSNYYTGSLTSDKIQPIQVSKPIATNFITGGGYVLLTSDSTGAPAGSKAGNVGSKNNFGFNVKYNSSGTNLQGRINTIIRSGDRIYQVKGNSMQSLTVPAPCPNATATTPCDAVFVGKANITDVTNPLAPISIGGNATLQMTMTDKGEPGSADSIGITVWEGNGALFFSSKWSGVAAVKSILRGGNLVVH